MKLSRDLLVSAGPRQQWVEIIGGLMIGFVGTSVTVLGIAALILMLHNPRKNWPYLAAAILIVIGGRLLPIAWRLLTGRMRKDGGLFSPFELRIAGVFFLLIPLVVLACDRVWVIESLMFFPSCAGACFWLAVKRAELRGSCERIDDEDLAAESNRLKARFSSSDE